MLGRRDRSDGEGNTAPSCLCIVHEMLTPLHLLCRVLFVSGVVSVCMTDRASALVMPPVATADPFDRCLRVLRTSRRGRHITPATWATLAGVRPDTSVLAHLDAQPEFTLPVWDYVAVMADDERVRDGVQQLAMHRLLFDRVVARYGVDAETIAAVWGIESNFGRSAGTLPVLRSLATLSCAGRRQKYFRGELLSALRIVQGGHITPQRFLGSWAGAFGQTQFMPGVFWWRAVDFDGDGKRDLMDNTGDALASTANFLHHAGWIAGMPWGIEVRIPGGDSAAAFVHGNGRRVRRPLREWMARGVTRVNGAPLAAASRDSAMAAGLFTPAGPGGPAFLVTSNFSAIFSYNAAESYVLAIAHLSDRLRGGAAIVTPWPTDDPGLSRTDRRELQALLQARGHDVGAADGLLTTRVRAAVTVEQRRLGQQATGRPGQRLLSALRVP
jgi:lytic murein transglycosylase